MSRNLNHQPCSYVPTEDSQLISLTYRLVYSRAFCNARPIAQHLKSPKSWKKLDLSQIKINNWDASRKSCKKWEKVGYSNHSCLIYPPMDIPQILQFVDEAVYAKTDKHLNDLQRRIIGGILNGQKYADVSESYGYSTNHVKKASHELLQMLSDIFGEQVKKSNLESVLERQINQNITNFGNKNTHHKNIISIGYISSCPASSTPTPEKSDPETPDFQQQSKNQTKIETIDKLRQFGLSDEQIAEALDIPLDRIKSVELEE